VVLTFLLFCIIWPAVKTCKPSRHKVNNYVLLPHTINVKEKLMVHAFPSMHLIIVSSFVSATSIGYKTLYLITIYIIQYIYNIYALLKMHLFREIKLKFMHN